MPTWRVYILRCRDGSLYTGCTNDLDARLSAHSAGKGAKYTASRLPVQVVYTEPADSKSAAMRREIQIKRWTKAKKEAFIAGNHQKRKRLSKCNPSV
jgi:putative endonuclease